MPMLEALPVAAYAGIAVVILMIAMGRRMSGAIRWIFPVALGAAFLFFTIFAIGREGLSLFWDNHTTNLAGNQVWLDLLFAVTIAFYLIAPRARAVGMPLLPWAVAVAITASIALLPMLARVIWLEQRAGR